MISVAVVDGFYCLCNPGYAGVKCDQDIDDCIVNACEHNSTCVDLHLVSSKIFLIKMIVDIIVKSKTIFF